MSPEQAQAILDLLLKVAVCGLVAILIAFGILVAAVWPRRNGR